MENEKIDMRTIKKIENRKILIETEYGVDIKIYSGSISPFNEWTAKEFVKEHKNICASSTRRSTVWRDTDYVAIKENFTIDYGDGIIEKNTWVWIFCRKENIYLIAMLNEYLTNKEIQEMVKKIIKEVIEWK